MQTDKLIFSLSQSEDAIDVRLRGEVIPVVRMLCRSMGEYPEVRDALLSAAATYLREHPEQVMRFKINSGL